MNGCELINDMDVSSNDMPYMGADSPLYSATPSTPRYELIPNFTHTNNFKLRNLGKSGLKLPIIGFAVWNSFVSRLSEQAAEEILSVAYENGINYFDTGDAFINGRCEIFLGQILRKNNWRRNTYIISTKLFWNIGPSSLPNTGLSRKFLVESLEASLKRLQLKYVDIVIINKLDGMCPMEEIVRTMAHIIDKGYAFYWGTSRWSPTHLMEAFSVARQFNCPPPCCEQMEYHMFNREKMELYMPEVYHKLGIGAITWSSYSLNNDEGISLISRRAANEEKNHRNLKTAELEPIFVKLACDQAQFTTAWSLRNENINSVLIAPRSLDQLYLQLNSLKLIPKLTPSQLEEIEKILDNRPFLRKPQSSTSITNPTNGAGNESCDAKETATNL